MSELSHHDDVVLRDDVARALDHGEFELWFQPKVRLQNLRITGVEGLARWRHPTLGVLAPNRFLSLLSDPTLLGRFTNQMIEQAIEFASAASKISDDIEVAVNLGPRSFLVPSLADYIDWLLNVHHVRPELLVIEVTEHDLVEDTPAAVGTFQALRRLGVHLSIDDFGTGYSSLARLRRLPVDELKIDREFVGALGTADEDMVIVRTIIELARLLDHATVAEGIETVEQLQILRSLGCIHGQGWLFARAMEPQQMLATLAQTSYLPPPTPLLPQVSQIQSFPAEIAQAAWGRDGIRLESPTQNINDALITDRQQLQMTTAMLDIMPCAAFIKDQAGRFVRVNAHARAALGFDALSDVVGRTDFDVYSLADAERFQIDDEHVLATGEPIVDKSERHTLIDGSTTLLRTTKIPVRNSTGQVIGLIGFSTDPSSP